MAIWSVSGSLARTESRGESGCSWSWCQFDGHHLDWLSNACQQQFSATISNTFSAKCHKTIEIERQRERGRARGIEPNGQADKQTNGHSLKQTRTASGPRGRRELDASGFSDVVSVEPEPRQRLARSRLAKCLLARLLTWFSFLIKR